RQSLLPHSPRRTQGRLKPPPLLPRWRPTYTQTPGGLPGKRNVYALKPPKTTPVATWLTPDLHRTHGRPPEQEYRLRLKRPTPNASRRCPPFKSSTAFRALAPAASFRGSLCFASLSAKNMAHHI